MDKFRKIVMGALIIGWFPLLLLTAFVEHFPNYLRVTLICVSAFLCMVGALTLLFSDTYNTMWFTRKELHKLYDEWKEKRDEADDVLEAVKRIAINDLGFDRKRLETRVEQIKKARLKRKV